MKGHIDPHLNMTMALHHIHAEIELLPDYSPRDLAHTMWQPLHTKLYDRKTIIVFIIQRPAWTVNTGGQYRSVIFFSYFPLESPSTPHAKIGFQNIVGNMELNF